jgi:hypothetical protein
MTEHAHGVEHSSRCIVASGVIQQMVNRVLTSPLLCYPSVGAAGGPAVD